MDKDDILTDRKTIIEKLRAEYGDAKPGLEYGNPFELLIATILSAQCTDERVNAVTRVLFEKASKPEEIIAMGRNELGETIRSCGLHSTKSKNIIKACELILSDFAGRVPETRKSLMELPGVGRKTANVVISHAFGKNAIAVDTHVFRVANRLGLSDSKTVLETEKQLMENIDESDWSAAHLWLIHHGRRVCKARKPDCENCVLYDECRYAKNKVVYFK